MFSKIKFCILILFICSYYYTSQIETNKPNEQYVDSCQQLDKLRKFHIQPFKRDFKWNILIGTKNAVLKQKSLMLKQFDQTQNKTLILYSYYERGDQIMKNFQYFVRIGVHDVENYDYLIIINGFKCMYCELEEFKQKLAYKNVQAFYRKNLGHDFGAYREGLLHIINQLKKYKYFVFINDSCIGPLLPRYWLDKVKEWPRIFTDLINDQVKLVGTTITTFTHLGVQSFAFAIDNIALYLFIKKGVFNGGSQEMAYTILNSEFKMTREIILANYTIDSMLIQYSKYNWTKLWQEGFQSYQYFTGGYNPTFPGIYGKHDKYDLSPAEVVFYKISGSQRNMSIEGIGELCPNNKCSFDGPVFDLCLWIQKYFGY